MGKKTVLAKKKRGPAPTGIGVQVVVRMQPAPLAALDSWSAKQDDKPTRAEAIRRLVELGLTVKSAVRPTAKAAARAAELAAKAIDKHADTSAPSAERESRKNKLLKGPSVFRDVRKDRAK
jgi:antitoxin component of RelBE/YafQ-DinJ toxin-antitoxin module